MPFVLKNLEVLYMITEIFGEKVFNLSVMRERLPKETFQSLEHTIKDGTPLDP